MQSTKEAINDGARDGYTLASERFITFHHRKRRPNSAGPPSQALCTNQGKHGDCVHSWVACKKLRQLDGGGRHRLSLGTISKQEWSKLGKIWLSQVTGKVAAIQSREDFLPVCKELLITDTTILQVISYLSNKTLFKKITQDVVH